MKDDTATINSTIFAMLRSALWGEKLNIDANTDWGKVTFELKAQTVLGIAASAQFSENFPDDIRQKWETEMFILAGRFYKILEEQKKLLEILKSHQIPVVILKGTAAAIYYPHPELRTMGDIDFLVPMEQAEETYQLLINSGYNLEGEKDECDMHIGLEKNKIRLELHRYFGRFDSIEEMEKMQSLLRDGMKNADVTSCAGEMVVMLPPLENGLALLNHTMKHMRGGIGLRHVIDWMMYVKCYLTDEYWNQEFESVAKQFGMDSYARIITRTCQLYLGLPEEDITWCKNVDENICRQFIDYVMCRGNFAKKEQDVNSKVIKAFSECDTIVDWINRLQKSGEYHWKAIQRYPILKSLAWIYGGVYYFRSATRQKNAFSKLLQEKKEGQKRKQFLDELHLPDWNVAIVLKNDEFIEEK